MPGHSRDGCVLAVAAAYRLSPGVETPARKLSAPRSVSSFELRQFDAKTLRLACYGIVTSAENSVTAAIQAAVLSFLEWLDRERENITDAAFGLDDRG